MRGTLHDRFWAKVLPEPNSGCWFWMGYRGTNGYGYAYTHDHVYGLAHRVAYTSTVGPIPDGLTIDHLCRVRCCVNPDHLEAVPIKENLHRGLTHAAKNAQKTHCPHGHPYAGENLRYSRVGRVCRACGKLKARNRYRQAQGVRPEQYRA